MTIIREERKYTTALQMDDNFQDSSLNTAHQQPSEREGPMTDTSIMLTGGYNSNVKLSKCNTRNKESLSVEDINLNRMSTACGTYENSSTYFEKSIQSLKFHIYYDIIFTA